MKQNYEQSLKYVLQDEGGNDDDPQDHGGRTSRGITQREYNAWCRLNSKGQGDVWCAADHDVATIYHDQYWNPYCDRLPSGVDYLFFDISVNAGRTQAVRTFQKALGVKVDGMLGQITLDAMLHSDPETLIDAVSDKRNSFYRSLAQFPRYGKGWTRRVENGRRRAKGMIVGVQVPTEDVKVPKATNQAPAKPTVSPETTGGAAVTTIGLSQLLDMLSKLITEHRDIIMYSGQVLLAVGFMSLLYMGWSMYKQKKVQQAQ